MPDLITLDGSRLSAATDGLVHTSPPKPPAPPAPTPVPAPAPALSELVDRNYAGKSATQLAAAPLQALKGISPTRAAALTQALGVHTIAELATNKYVTAAQTIAAAAQHR